MAQEEAEKKEAVNKKQANNGAIEKRRQGAGFVCVCVVRVAPCLP
jgi:hypothetical protein